MKPPQSHALILSGGQGERFDSLKPKQFVLLKDRPLFLHSLLAFLSWKEDIRITLVVAAEHAQKSQELVEKFLEKDGELDKGAREASFPSIAFVHGGKKRHLSCLAGLDHILREAQNEDIILIHDAARPILCPEELDRLWEEILYSQSALVSLASPLSETLVRAKKGSAFGSISNSLDRDGIYVVKTPQAIRVHTLREMMKQKERKDDFTDLLTWGESCGLKGSLLEAGPYNWKVTRKADLELLELVLTRR